MKDALGEVQSVLVLGGTSDIGVATARALVERRARTVRHVEPYNVATIVELHPGATGAG